MWVGLRLVNGNWIWADSAVVITSRWSSGHPEGSKGCAKMSSSDKFLEWKSHRCNIELPVACFIESLYIRISFGMDNVLVVLSPRYGTKNPVLFYKSKC